MLPTGPILLVLGLALVTIVLAVLIRLFAPGRTARYRQKAFLSPAERSFLGVLSQAAGEDWRVFAKVRIADVLTPEKGLNRSRWQSAFNAISAKHFDFLLCDPTDCAPKLAIELDDKSHETNKARRRDRLVESACESAGLPLLRVKAARAYQIAEIRGQVEKLTAPKSESESSAESTGVYSGRREPRFGPAEHRGT